MPEDMLIRTALVPLAASIVAVALLRLSGGRGPWLAAGAVAVGFLAGLWAIAGAPVYPPRTAAQKLFYIVGIGLAAGLLLDLGGASRRVVWAVAAIAPAAAVAWLAWQGLLRLDVAVVAVSVVAATVGGAALCSLYRDRGDAATAAAALLVGSVGAAVLAAFGSSGAFGQFGGALGAAVGGFLLWNWPAGRHAFAATGLLGGGLALVALIAALALFSDTPAPALAALALVFAAPYLAARLPGPRGRAAEAAAPVVVAAVAAVPALAAVGIAHLMGGSVYGY